MRLDVDEHRGRGDVMNRSRCGEEGERRRYDLIAAADVERTQREEQRIRAARAADRILGLRQLGDLLLELLDGRSENEELRVDDGHQGGHDFVTDRGVLRAQIQQWYGHGVEYGLMVNIEKGLGSRG